MILSNVPLEVKKVFLSFAQQYFKTEHPTLIWNVDPRQTKIFIGDKYSLNPAIVERMPSIILSRGTMIWAQTSINQLQEQDSPFGNETTKKRTDLVRCNVTIQCTSKNGIEAESIANLLFINLVGYKDQLRSHGIHQILGVSMGEEVPVRGDVEPRLMAVPINISFTVQSTVVTSTDDYDIRVTTNLADTPQIEEGIVNKNWYSYLVSGNNLVFSEPPPVGASLKATYKGKYTLDQYTNVVPSGTCDGINVLYSLTEEPYCIYETLYHISISGLNN